METLLHKLHARTGLLSIAEVSDLLGFHEVTLRNWVRAGGLESFDTLKKHFGDDREAADIIDRETRCASEWIGENTPEEPKRKPRKLGKVETADRPDGARSIFDDIDEDGNSATSTNALNIWT